MVMARLIGDEMEPSVKVKLFNFCVEYKVRTVMALMGLTDPSSSVDAADVLASSVATVTKLVDYATLTRQSSDTASDATLGRSKMMQLDLLLRDTAIGLNPMTMPAKGLVLFTNARFAASLPVNDHFKANLDVRRASILIVDDVAGLSSLDRLTPRASTSALGGRHVHDLCGQGYVSVSTISAARLFVQVIKSENGNQTIDVDVKNELFVLESCADSTQTLIGLLDDLKPPIPPSKEVKYRTSVLPIEDMMASFTGDAFSQPADNATDDDVGPEDIDPFGDLSEDDFNGVDSVYAPEASYVPDKSMADNDLLGIPRDGARSVAHRSVDDTHTPDQDLEGVSHVESFVYMDDHIRPSSANGTNALKWDSVKNQYVYAIEIDLRRCPLK
ncbi:hypothetical protein LTS18_013626, partial [Coniosporium uncinatum]